MLGSRIQILVVSLERSTERRRKIASHLSAMGLSFEFQSATDATRFSAEDMERLRRENVIASTFEGVPASVGCALSHQAAYRRMVEQDIPKALILEDDAVLAPATAGLLPRLERELRDDEVILLFYQFDEIRLSSQNTVPLHGGYRLLYPMRRNIMGAVGYLLTKKTAAQILAANTPIAFAADIWSQFHKRGAFRAIRVVSPQLVAEEIGLTTRRPNVRGLSLFRRAMAELHYRKVFPLHQYSQWKAARVRRRRTTVSIVDETSPLVM